MCCKDCFGNIVEVGDTVAFVTVYYHDLEKGTVVKTTPKGVKVKDSKGYLFQRRRKQIALIEKGH